jgi:uncharacterized protein (DUF433 family)
MDLMSADDPPGGFTEMNATEIAIVDRGRGLQLSTSRITVQDLVPYFQEGCSHDEIIRWIPSLSHEEIAVVEHYYRENQAAMDEQDRRIRERTASRKNSSEIEEIRRRGSEKMAALRELLQNRKQPRECNGDHSPG